MTDFAIPAAWKAVVAAGAILGLSGCIYGGAGYYGDGYVNNSYACDPYAPFDDYYACDSGYGFANIGYGGGWYEQYYYPGYGVYIFDRAGHRHAMRHHHRRHWARQRAQFRGHHAGNRRWNSEHRSERRGHRYDRRGEVRDHQNGHYRGPRAERGDRPGARPARPNRDGQAAPAGNRVDQPSRPVRRPVMAAEQPQSRAAPPTMTPRVEGPRHSPRTGPNTRERISDE